MLSNRRVVLNLSGLSVGALALIGFAGRADAAGFEKSMLWSGKAVGQGGAVVGSVSGAESLYFNPAGLAKGNGPNGDVSINFSPTISKFSGPAPYRAGSLDSKSGFSPVAGGMASYQLSPQLGFGIGYYVSGGTKSEYDDIDYSSLNAQFNSTKATVKTDLAITEAALGVGYEVMPGLRIGAAWRPTFVAADFSTMAYIQNAAIANISVNDLKKTRWNGYKLGLQYAPVDSPWGLGLGYRSSVSFIAEGKSSGTIENATAAGNSTPMTGGTATIANTFPEQATAGMFYKISDTFRLALEYSFTHYSRDNRLNLTGSVTAPAGTLGATSTTIPLRNITEDWKNMHVGRIGGQYALSEATVARLGYAWTSQVTADQFARNTFSSPGTGNAITIGAGHACTPSIDLDGAFEYSWASGTGKNNSLSVSPWAETGTFRKWRPTRTSLRKPTSST